MLITASFFLPLQLSVAVLKAAPTLTIQTAVPRLSPPQQSWGSQVATAASRVCVPVTRQQESPAPFSLPPRQIGAQSGAGLSPELSLVLNCPPAGPPVRCLLPGAPPSRPEDRSRAAPETRQPSAAAQALYRRPVSACAALLWPFRLLPVPPVGPCRCLRPCSVSFSCSPPVAADCLPGGRPPTPLPPAATPGRGEAPALRGRHAGGDRRPSDQLSAEAGAVRDQGCK